MLISIASRQLTVLHCYLSATGQQFNNHANYVHWKTVRDRYNCRNLYLKVQGDDEVRKSPDKPFHVLMALQGTKSRECVAA